MKKARIIITLLVLLGAASLAEAQIVVSQTTASTTKVYVKSGREKGFILRPKFGFGAPSTLNCTAGYQFNPYFAIGAGTGLDVRLENFNSHVGFCMSLPLFVDVRTYFCDRKWSPFIDFKVGYCIPLTKVYRYDDYYYTMNGFRGDVGLGMQHNNFDFELVFTIRNMKYHDENNVRGNLSGGLMLSFAYNFQFTKK